MGKTKVQVTMTSSTPLLNGFGSLVVVTTCSFRELVAIIVAYTCENLWETITCTSISLLVILSYV